MLAEIADIADHRGGVPAACSDFRNRAVELRRRREIVDRDVEPLASQSKRDRLADTAARAGNEGPAGHAAVSIRVKVG